MALELSIITIRDIFQDEAGKKSRYSEEYKSQSALIILDKQDLAGLGAKDGQSLLVKNDVGSIVVSARLSEDTHPGLAEGFAPQVVEIALKQHIGAPAACLVAVGDRVSRGDLIGEIPEKALGARVHASIDGTVTSVADGKVVIRA